ncbi:MAG: penicillin-binding transpeptidase domain-containing protein [Bacteroidales bacterium]|nr:penicillin-binding transpeptidase domain-containing protein [Bacteroidales bacterium]
MTSENRDSKPRNKTFGTRNSVGTAGFIRLRYILVATFIVAVAAGIVSSAVKTTIIHADEWNKKANEELAKEEEIPPVRGDILACDGSVLATNLTYYDVFVDFKASRFSDDEFRESLDSLADTLAVYLPLRDSKAWHERLSAQINVPRKNRSSSFLLAHNLSYSELQRLRDFPFFRRHRNPNRTGLVTKDYVRRKNPYGQMASLSIGQVGQTKTSNERHGVSGLEQALDSLLYGRPGRSKKVPLTHRISNWEDVKPRNGYTLTTTIDIHMQDIVENALSRVLRETEADWGTVILMHVPTGDIKAICNLERDTAGNCIEAMNRAILRVEPGSVMKAVSMVIALEDGFIPNPEQIYDIPHAYYYGSTSRGTEITDTHSPSQLPVSKFLCYSSNIGMTKLVAPHFEHDPNAFRERVRKLGLLDTFNTGISGEKPAYFPDLDLRRGGKMSLGRQTYGYCELVPPLYTCAFYNAIANNGRFVRPRLVTRISGEGIDSFPPVTYVRKQMCSEQTAATMRKWLKDVIYGKGGTALSIQNPYVEAAGKTGTAKITLQNYRLERAQINLHKPIAADSASAKSGYTNMHRYAFCGFFPYEKPQYTCMVIVANAHEPTRRSPDKTSAMVFRDIMLRMYSAGMLGDNSDYHTGTAAAGARPIVYANTDNKQIGNIKKMLNVTNIDRIKSPAKVSRGIPDVRGLNVRQAVVTLENAGYNVNVKGSGYVTDMSPAPATPAKPGTRVHLTLDSWRKDKHTTQPAGKTQPAGYTQSTEKANN